ncbi:folylpolyglutamate synthase-like [Manduca sexta]|uniref:folylpolyglutamate synthase-like n=1 Tax=Manduca sexta TaxID=7130 RepID=UPI00188ECFE8|nr:folylpolyglutamate synthase-like [Manduca sexta]
MHSIRVCSVVNRIVVRMVSTKNSYEDAVGKLNKLQSNKSTIEQIRKEKAGHKCTNVEDMEYYLKRTGVSLSKLDEMSVIHVAGTKGKGSTSAMCESILRITGSAQVLLLAAPRGGQERIRLDGKVVSEEQFAHYFHEVYGKLDC